MSESARMLATGRCSYTHLALDALDRLAQVRRSVHEMVEHVRTDDSRHSLAMRRAFTNSRFPTFI